jgi:hypothetical protein
MADPDVADRAESYPCYSVCQTVVCTGGWLRDHRHPFFWGGFHCNPSYLDMYRFGLCQAVVQVQIRIAILPSDWWAGCGRMCAPSDWCQFDSSFITHIGDRLRIIGTCYWRAGFPHHETCKLIHAIKGSQCSDQAYRERQPALLIQL